MNSNRSPAPQFLAAIFHARLAPRAREFPVRRGGVFLPPHALPSARVYPLTSSRPNAIRVHSNAKNVPPKRSFSDISAPIQSSAHLTENTGLMQSRKPRGFNQLRTPTTHFSRNSFDHMILQSGYRGYTPSRKAVGLNDGNLGLEGIRRRHNKRASAHPALREENLADRSVSRMQWPGVEGA
jgi:hypothetical protein